MEPGDTADAAPPSTDPSTDPPPATPADPLVSGWRRRSSRDDDQHPPDRPRRLTPHELRFEPQKATRWFSPGVLTASGLHVGVTSVFGSFLDKRELQTARRCEPDLRYAGREEIWLDYVADTGDGFEATATVAHQVAKPSLQPDGTTRSLPRGDILVFGGDEVYPAASTEGYEARLEGPWRAVLPWTEAAPTEPAHPTVYAIPGNHDWYDGLTGFLRMFGQGRWIGGWRTNQTRSYFAVALPHRWWLWGIDIQSDSLIDEPQLEFFDRVAQQAQPGDRLVLATAVPTWTQIERDPQAYRNLAYLERAVLRPAGLDLKLTLAGDMHHYARYVHEGDEDAVGPTHKITSGGGGAFLHPTHDLPPTATIGITPDDLDDTAEYHLETSYPSVGRSRLLSLHALLLPLRNPSFCVIPAIVNLVLLWTIQFGLRSLAPSGERFADAADDWGWTDLAGGMFRNSMSALMLIVLLGGLWAFAKSPPWAPRGIPRYIAKTVLAGAHLAAHVAAIATVSLVALTLASALDGWWFALAASAVAFVLGGAAGGLVVGAYLAAAIGLPRLRTHANEAFAAARLTGYKNFLRIHIDRTGALTVYALGIDKAVKRRWWRAVPEAEAPGASWIEPSRGEPHPRLIDEVTIT
jgi:hypothetical protein